MDLKSFLSSLRGGYVDGIYMSALERRRRSESLGVCEQGTPETLDALNLTPDERNLLPKFYRMWIPYLKPYVGKPSGHHSSGDRNFPTRATSSRPQPSHMSPARYQRHGKKGMKSPLRSMSARNRDPPNYYHEHGRSKNKSFPGEFLVPSSDESRFRRSSSVSSLLQPPLRPSPLSSKNKDFDPIPSFGKFLGVHYVVL